MFGMLVSDNFDRVPVFSKVIKHMCYVYLRYFATKFSSMIVNSFITLNIISYGCLLVFNNFHQF